MKENKQYSIISSRGNGKSYLMKKYKEEKEKKEKVK